MAFFAVVLAAICCPPAFAASPVSGPARVVLLGGDDQALSRKVRAEAESVGLVVVTPTEGGDAIDDTELLERYDAAAVIRVVSPDRADVRVGRADDGPSTRTLLRRTADGESFAVRVIEEVYARLVDLQLVAGESNPGAPRHPTPTAVDRPSVVAPSAPVPQRVSDHRGPRLWLDAGLAGSQAEGGMGPSGQGALGLRLEPVRRFSVGLHALLPITENSLTRPEGSADASVSLFLADLAFSPFDLGRNASVQAGAGGGVLVLAMSGEAAPPLMGHTERLTAGVFFAHAGISWALASWLRVSGTLLGGVSAPRPVLTFSGRDVATWGRAFAGLMLQTEFELALSRQDSR